jgi:hypothetical protein
MISVSSSLLGGVGVEEVCPRVSTKWPQTWGAHSWRTFHVMAQHYPEHASPEHRQACENFVGAIPYMLPCSTCGDHFRDFVGRYTLENGSMCTGQANLANFFCEGQNRVNQGTDKPLFSCCPAHLKATYGSMPLCIPNSIN